MQAEQEFGELPCAEQRLQAAEGWFPQAFLPCTCSQLITAEPGGFERLHWRTTSKAMYSALLISCCWEHCQCGVKLTLPKELKAEAFWLFSSAQECWCCCHLQAKWQMFWKWVLSGCCRTCPLPCLHFYSFVKLTGMWKGSPHLKGQVF